MRYAGFWIRFWAYIVDSIALVPISFLFYLKFAASFWDLSYGMYGYMAELGAAIYFTLFLASFLIPWLYFSLFESGAWQATPGKRLMGLRVTDINGNKLTFGKASVRYFSKILSTLLFYIGFIMVGITEKKQGLHDIIAETFVLLGAADNKDSEFISKSNGKISTTKGANWVLAGFDNDGHVVRLTFGENDQRFFSDGMTIGRDSKSCDLSIHDNSVSRQHAKISKNSYGLTIEDLNSTNGTSINGKVLHPGVPVDLPGKGDLVLGNVELSIGKY